LSGIHIKWENMLALLLREFNLWAETADRADAGWQGDFPKWRELISHANTLLTAPHVSEEELHSVGCCWAASEEDEECSRFARSHVNEPNVLEKVTSLTQHNDRDARWQAYDVLGSYSGNDAFLCRLLEVGLVDVDAYVRRRAFNMLLKKLPEARKAEYISKMLDDSEEYNRYVATKAAMKSNKAELQEQARLLLTQDDAVKELFDYYLEHKEIIDKYDD